MAKKRKFSTFNLAFLDIMSCGFGAVILIFLIIKHDADTQVENINQDIEIRQKACVSARNRGQPRRRGGARGLGDPQGW